jgi:hypothetical protein
VRSTRLSSLRRYTGAAITSDLAWLIGAGFAPLAALLLSSHFGLLSVGAYLLSGAVATLAALGSTRNSPSARPDPDRPTHAGGRWSDPPAVLFCPDRALHRFPTGDA